MSLLSQLEAECTLAGRLTTLLTTSQSLKSDVDEKCRDFATVGAGGAYQMPLLTPFQSHVQIGGL
jgi:hypothetical protein